MRWRLYFAAVGCARFFKMPESRCWNYSFNWWFNVPMREEIFSQFTRQYIVKVFLESYSGVELRSHCNGEESLMTALLRRNLQLTSYLDFDCGGLNICAVCIFRNTIQYMRPHVNVLMSTFHYPILFFISVHNCVWWMNRIRWQPHFQGLSNNKLAADSFFSLSHRFYHTHRCFCPHKWPRQMLAWKSIQSDTKTFSSRRYKTDYFLNEMLLPWHCTCNISPIASEFWRLKLIGERRSRWVLLMQ